MAFRDDLQNWDVPDGTVSETIPEWTIGEDGWITVTFPPGFAYNLGEDLAKWREFANEKKLILPKGWKRSPIQRENRREAYTFSNCLETIKVLLGRPSVNALMDRVQALETEKGRWPRSTDTPLDGWNLVTDNPEDLPQIGERVLVWGTRPLSTPTVHTVTYKGYTGYDHTRLEWWLDSCDNVTATHWQPAPTGPAR